MAKFPAFCDESASPLGYNDDDTCRREIAAFFAHINITSDGLAVKEDVTCAESTDATICGFRETASAAPASSLFFARGPLGLKGEKDYADFSAAFYEGFARSDELLMYPERVACDGYFGFSAALWLWMTPRLPSASPHNVMSGFFVPNTSDLQAGHTDGFGTTINILSNADCGTWTSSPGAEARLTSFKNYSTMMGIQAETQKLTCEKMWADFSWGGSAN